MKIRFFILFLYCLSTLSLHAAAAAEKRLFRFGVASQAVDTKNEESDFADMLATLNDEKLAFIVASGLKSPNDPCSDDVYSDRRDLFEGSKNPLIPSLAASDWTKCLGQNGKSAAGERLSRVREIFFSENASFGEKKIPLIRQSLAPQFRSYSENARWRIRNILFANIHLPQNNNNYVSEAGRNAEFEDRLIANRDWLQKLFILAKRKKIDGIVLFSDGNPLALAGRERSATDNAGRDGFREVRQQILKLVSAFPGKVLLVHTHAAHQKSLAPSGQQIQWNRNLGEMYASEGILLVSVTASPTLFVLDSQVENRRRSTGSEP